MFGHGGFMVVVDNQRNMVPLEALLPLSMKTPIIMLSAKDATSIESSSHESLPFSRDARRRGCRPVTRSAGIAAPPPTIALQGDATKFLLINLWTLDPAATAQEFATSTTAPAFVFAQRRFSRDKCPPQPWTSSRSCPAGPSRRPRARSSAPMPA